MMDDTSWMAFLRACSANDTQSVAYCLRRRMDPNYQHPDCRTSPFLVAVQAGHWQCVQLLLEAGASATDFERRTGLSPLQLALQRGHHSIVDMLLTRLSRDERRKGGIKTILVSGSMQAELLRVLAATGHTLLVDDDQSVPEMMKDIQVATMNRKVQLANLIKAELREVTDLILRETEDRKSVV